MIEAMKRTIRIDDLLSPSNATMTETRRLGVIVGKIDRLQMIGRGSVKMFGKFKAYAFSEGDTLIADEFVLPEVAVSDRMMPGTFVGFEVFGVPSKSPAGNATYHFELREVNQ